MSWDGRPEECPEQLGEGSSAGEPVPDRVEDDFPVDGISIDPATLVRCGRLLNDKGRGADNQARLGRETHEHP